MLLDENERLRYSRQIQLHDVGIAGQLRLKQAKVLCIGAGGLGAPLLQYLAAAGVGTIGIIDDDIVELSNLQRQIIFSVDDVGKSKALCAQSHLLKLNPELNVRAYQQKFSSSNARQLIQEYDVIADCTDILANRYLLNSICLEMRKSFVFAGISQHQGQCMWFDAQNGPCFECLFPFQPEAQLPDCNSGGVVAVLPGIIGSMQAACIIRSILEIGTPLTGILYQFHLANMEWCTYQVTRQPDCEACVHHIQRSEILVCSHDGDCAITLDQITHEYVLLDVRTIAEHDENNIGGKLIPLPELPRRLHELNREEKVVVYCQSGKRSAQAVDILRRAGFKQVYSLRGGMASAESCDMI